MKLALSQQDGIAILTGTESISAHDVEVLRAGLTKILKSGRNRIVLELPQADQIPMELIREIFKFDELARELSGRVVLAGSNANLRKRLAEQKEPPSIDCFEGLEAAIQQFKNKLPAKPPLKTPVAPPIAAPAAVANPAQKSVATQTPVAAPASTAAPAVEDAHAQQVLYKAEIKQREINELGPLRQRNTQLENENQALLKQLHSSWLGSQIAPAPAQQAQMEEMTERLEELMELSKGK